jgi:hypothetical protein
MKLEWGKKICCPACALPFYGMQLTSVVCPNCGKTFDVSELFTKKSNRPVVVETDVIDIEDNVLVISDFGFEEGESENTVLSEDSNELLVKTEIDDMKLVDEE